MSIRTIIAVAIVFASGTALAQEKLGTIDTVQGIVTVTDGTTGGIARTGAPINDGMRFVASSNGSALLRLNNRCDIRLQPNQAVTVLKSMNCAALLAAVQSVGVNVAAAGSAGTGALATGGLVAGGLVLNKTYLGGKKSISSN
jgi:hypothetical protein